MDHIDNDWEASDVTQEANSHELADDAEGFGKPPMVRRFKKGETGNPRGRPRGSKNRKTIVKNIMNEMHTVTEDGRRQRRSTLELVLIAFRNRGADGNPRAFREYRKFLAKYEPQESSSKGGYLVVPARQTEEEALAEAEKVNAAGRANYWARRREYDLAAGRSPK